MDLFDKQYIHVDQSVAPVETSPLDKKYQALVDKINTLDTDTYGLPKKDLDRMFKRDNSEKVIADVMGVLDKREFEKEGYIYWRL